MARCGASSRKSVAVGSLARKVIAARNCRESAMTMTNSRGSRPCRLYWVAGNFMRYDCRSPRVYASVIVPAAHGSYIGIYLTDRNKQCCWGTSDMNESSAFSMISSTTHFLAGTPFTTDCSPTYAACIGVPLQGKQLLPRTNGSIEELT
jgi:hypothetical protein